MENKEMKILTQAELQNLSFPDSIVEDMKIDVLNKELKIKTDSGFLSINSGVELNSCCLLAKNWQSIRATIYHAKTKMTEILDVNKLDKLIDICEFEFGEEIIFRGFGEKGGWIEIILVKAILEVEVVDA